MTYDNDTKCYGWVGDKSECHKVVVPEGVTSIGKYAFSDCKDMSSIEIPSSVTSIGFHAFEYCDKLQPNLLVYNNGTRCYGWIGDKTNCVNVLVPNGVVEIDDFAFEYCMQMESIEIPSSVKTIGGASFISCSGLVNLEIPSSVINIGEKSFETCCDLQVLIHNPKDKINLGKDAFCSWKNPTYTK